ncbi:MAG: hypothetical protein JWO80_4173 [Bryobacterales bacterium]|nr:hypothetical protein [Bryobacterales bacterium]
MKTTPLRIAAGLLAAILLAPATSGPEIQPSFFPYQQGWLGGDAAYSIPLDRDSTAWLFGDTFVGDPRQGGKVIRDTMIHNSIGIRKCRVGCSWSYWWSDMDVQKPDSFFKTSESSYYWPLDGFTHRKVLYVFLEQMHATGAGGAFGFDYSGVTLAAVSNFTAPPSRWRITYRPLSRGNQVIPGIAAAVATDSGASYVYVFTLFRRPGAQPFVGLLRLPLTALGVNEPLSAWQYLSKDSGWLAWTFPSTSPADAAEALAGNITEMTVKYQAQIGQWIAVYPTPGSLSNTAVYSLARTLGGPWSKPDAFFHYPEMEKADPRYTPNVFCYGVKEHPELESPGRFAFTYACNSSKVSEVLRDTRLYRPALVIDKLPGNLQSGHTP